MASAAYVVIKRPVRLAVQRRGTHLPAVGQAPGDDDYDKYGNLSYMEKFERVNVSFLGADKDGDGAVDSLELRTWWENVFGASCSEPFFAFIFEMLDKNGNGRVDILEFADFIMGVSQMQRRLKFLLEQGSSDKNFTRFDVNHDGGLSKDEFRQFLKSLSLGDIDHRWLDVELLDVQYDARGLATREELARWVMAHVTAQTLEEKVFEQADRIWESFAKVDVNGDGIISESEFFNLLNKLQPDRFDESRCRALFRVVDNHKKGYISFKEFVSWIKRDDLLSKIESNFQDSNESAVENSLMSRRVSHGMDVARQFSCPVLHQSLVARPVSSSKLGESVRSSHSSSSCGMEFARVASCPVSHQWTRDGLSPSSTSKSREAARKERFAGSTDVPQSPSKSGSTSLPQLLPSPSSQTAKRRMRPLAPAEFLADPEWLPAGWTARISRSKGKVYYQHLSGLSQWIKPV